MSKGTRLSVTVLRVSLRICIVVLFVVVSGYETPSQHAAQGSNSLDYHVWRVYPEDRRGHTIVVVSVNPKHFNRNDMSSLATEFNKQFADKKKLKIGLLEDADIARLFAEGKISYPTYARAERGRYYLDRDACKEYVQFEGKKGKPRETVRFNCKR